MLDSRSGLVVVVGVVGIWEPDRVSISLRMVAIEVSLIATDGFEFALIILEAGHVVWSGQQALRVKRVRAARRVNLVQLGRRCLVCMYALVLQALLLPKLVNCLVKVLLLGHVRGASLNDPRVLQTTHSKPVFSLVRIHEAIIGTCSRLGWSLKVVSAISILVRRPRRRHTNSVVTA